MSLITAFPFHAYLGDLKTRKVLDDKTAVSLSLLSSEDLARMAFVEVRTRCGQEDKATPWLPVRRRGEAYPTFYDTRMGNFDVRTFPSQACTTCTNAMTGKFGNERCQGHFGYIGMPRRYPNDPSRANERYFIVNPHLSGEVEQLLQAECFFCHHLRVPEFDVARYYEALRLMDAGLIGDALHFLEVVSNAKGQDARNRRRRDANEEIINDTRMLREYVERLLAAKGVRSTARPSAVGGEGEKREDRRAQASVGTAGSSAIAGPEEERGQEEEDEADDEDPVARSTHKSVTDIRNHICRQALKEFRDYMYVCSHCQAISPRITTKNGHLFFFFNKKNAEFNVAQGALTTAQLRDWEEVNHRHGRTHTYYHTSIIREHIKELCQKESAILGALFPHLGEATVSMSYACPLPPNMLYKVFFLDKILVPPLPLRLSSGVQVSESGTIAPDSQTRALSDVLGFVEQIETYNTLRNNSTAERNLISAAQEVANEHNLRNLQAKVTEVYTDILESFAKKEGLFRMHMMGKRVNQACRSVISPDYLVEPNEVLLPRPFARSLTYPEQVSAFAPARTLLLKRCVINGPTTYPGATHLEIRHASGEVRFVDLNVPEQTRRQHAMKYFAMLQGGTLIVHRHILDGDRLIFNRQPTLHKPSMMGYRAKVLSGLKTLRFHYVNGKSYNADFDGDEMNIHVAQSVEAKAELECLMDANLNYLVPTSGKPLRGLIQDHIVAGVLLTLRDKFLNHDTFVQFAYNGVAPYMRLHGNPLAAHATLTELVPVPAILKPRPLWTGKQLISLLVHYVTGVVSGRGVKPKSEGVSLQGVSLIQPNAYTTTNAAGELVALRRGAMDDDKVQFMNSELIVGVLCKNQLGPSSLAVTHVIHEIYGPHMVGELFGALGRVLTMSLQREGFSMGMDDMCLLQEDRRERLLRELDDAPLALPDEEAKVMPVIMNLATKLQKEFVPGRMLVPFPRNQLLMMTMSGAKGSNTNTIQMALGLGQQLFDGRRVKRMNSGKTLPAFFVGEKRSRSFGYAIGRFASGIRPAEYTIHAMAGRDGLIDTAVKTSRSGHLQRCLIKGLESLVVQWDHSVRDSNGAVIQFLYGGDGLDPMKASTLQAWEMAKENVIDLSRRFGVDLGLGGDEDGDEAAAAAANVPSAGEEGGGVATSGGAKRSRADEALAAQRARRLALIDAEAQRDPLPPHLRKSLQQYLDGKASFPLFRKVGQVARWNQQHTTIQKLREKRQESVEYYGDVIGDLTARKRVRAYCDPGEPVGLLAAQAAGEPSTQMTLNTFHSAGSTVTHVTEGIPRLRELLIHASVQNAAIIVPVEKAGEADEVAITRILRAGVETRLLDCVVHTPARGVTPASKGYHYHVQHGPEGSVITVSLLFSRTVLKSKQEDMCMSPAEHLDAFTTALKLLAKSIIAALRGRSREGAGEGGKAGGAAAAADGGSGLLQDTVQDPAFIGGGRAALANDGAESVDEELLSEKEADSDAEDEQRSTQVNTPALGAKKPPIGAAGGHTHKRTSPSSGRAKKAGNEETDGEEEDDLSGSGSARSRASSRSSSASSRGVGGRNATQREGDDDEDEDEPVWAGLADSGDELGNNNDNDEEEQRRRRRLRLTQTYDSFEPMRLALGNKKFNVEIAPLASGAAAAADVVAMPSDLFIVNVVIHSTTNVVAVVPDVLETALEHQVLPSWLPQFHSVTFTRKAEDTSSGEMVFQGPSATMRNVTSFLSLFTVRAKAIKVAKARSTDIQDMRISLGVESAYKSLFDELDKLFRRYAVDYHHLSLIADAAVHRGVWENYNYTGVISQSASPLFQMTFASSKRFLHTALTRGIGDELNSISSAIMVGERPKVGTACVKVSQDASILRDVVEKNLV